MPNIIYAFFHTNVLEIFNKGAKTIQWGGGEKLSSSNKNKITRYSDAKKKKKRWI